MLLLWFLTICSAELDAPCKTDIFEGPRETTGKARGENIINIEIRDGDDYKLRAKNSTDSVHINDGRILLDYRAHTSFTTTIFLVTSILFQIVTMMISFILLMREPRYIPKEPSYVKIYQPEKIENLPLKNSDQSLQCNDSLRTQEYI